MFSPFRLFSILALLTAFLAGASLLLDFSELPGKTRKPDYPRLVRTDASVPVVSAEAVRVERIRSGEILFQKDADRRLPVASLTKLMTGLLLAETSEPLAEIFFSPEAKRAGAPDDKQSAVKAGDSIRAEDVLKLLLASSDADAAYAASEHVARAKRPVLGSASFSDRVSFFVELMNVRAQELGLTSTHFANPTGADDPDNYSSARDIARLAGELLRTSPEAWSASRLQEGFVFGSSGARYGVVNTNPLLGEYPAIYGSKTGFEDEAKGALAILYQLAPDERVAIVLLRSSDRFRDGRALIQWLEKSFMLEFKKP